MSTGEAFVVSIILAGILIGTGYVLGVAMTRIQQLETRADELAEDLHTLWEAVFEDDPEDPTREPAPHDEGAPATNLIQLRTVTRVA